MRTAAGRGTGSLRHQHTLNAALVQGSITISDVFAVGSAVYEIMTGHEPYEHLGSIDDMEQIEALFRNEKFPSTESILAHNVVEDCWRQRYDSAQQCVRDVADLEGQRQTVVTWQKWHTSNNSYRCSLLASDQS